MSKVTKNVIRFRDLRWTVYNQDDPDQIFGESLTGPESSKLMKDLQERCINAMAINE